MPLKKTAGDITAQELNQFVDAYNKLIEITGDEYPDASPEEQVYQAILKYRDMQRFKLDINASSPDTIVGSVYGNEPYDILFCVPFNVNANAKLKINDVVYPIYYDNSPIDDSIKDGEVVYLLYDESNNRYNLMRNSTGLDKINGLKYLQVPFVENVNFRPKFGDKYLLMDTIFKLFKGGNLLTISYNTYVSATITIIHGVDDTYITRVYMYNGLYYIKTNKEKLQYSYEYTNGMFKVKIEDIKGVILTDIISDTEDITIGVDGDVSVDISTVNDALANVEEVYNYNTIYGLDKNVASDYIESNANIDTMPTLALVNQKYINTVGDKLTHTRKFNTSGGYFAYASGPLSFSIKEPNAEWKQILTPNDSTETEADIISELKGSNDCDKTTAELQADIDNWKLKLDAINDNYVPLYGPGVTETAKSVLADMPMSDLSAIPKKWADENLVAKEDANTNEFEEGYVSDISGATVTNSDLLRQTDMYVDNGNMKYTEVDETFTPTNTYVIDNDFSITKTDTNNVSKTYPVNYMLGDTNRATIRNSAIVKEDGIGAILEPIELIGSYGAIYIRYKDGRVYGYGNNSGCGLLTNVNSGRENSIGKGWYLIADNSLGFVSDGLAKTMMLQESTTTLKLTGLIGAANYLNGTLTSLTDTKLGKYSVSRYGVIYSSSVYVSGAKEGVAILEYKQRLSSDNDFKDNLLNHEIDSCEIGGTLHTLTVDNVGMLKSETDQPFGKDYNPNHTFMKHDGVKKAKFLVDSNGNGIAVVALCWDGTVHLLTNNNFMPFQGEFGNIMCIANSVKDFEIYTDLDSDDTNYTNLALLGYDKELNLITFRNVDNFWTISKDIQISQGVELLTSTARGIVYLTETLQLMRLGYNQDGFPTNAISTPKSIYLPLDTNMSDNIGYYIGNMKRRRLEGINIDNSLFETNVLTIDSPFRIEHSNIKIGYKCYNPNGSWIIYKNIEGSLDNSVWSIDRFDNTGAHISQSTYGNVNNPRENQILKADDLFILTAGGDLLVKDSIPFIEVDSYDADWKVPTSPSEISGAVVEAFAYYKNGNTGIVFWCTDNKIYGKGKNFNKILDPSADVTATIDATVLYSAPILRVNDMEVVASGDDNDVVVNLLVDIDISATDSGSYSNTAGLLEFGGNGNDTIGSFNSIFANGGPDTNSYFASPRVRRMDNIQFGNYTQAVVVETTNRNFFIVTPNIAYSGNGSYTTISYTERLTNINNLHYKLKTVTLRSFSGYKIIDDNKTSLAFIGEDEEQIIITIDKRYMSSSIYAYDAVDVSITDAPFRKYNDVTEQFKEPELFQVRKFG